MKHKLLIANRGEIALRVIRSAVKLGVPTIAIYTLADASTPHVSQADEAYLIGDGNDPRGYLDIEAILAIARSSGATMVAPGYGFLSENATFAAACEANGLVFLGPTPHQMTSMGLKHEARAIAIRAGVPVVPGSDGVVEELQDAIRIARNIGYPILIKASGGGGGMGMQVCRDEAALVAHFEATRAKGAALFKEPAVFLEKFITRARHIEVQIFGNGTGHVVHFEESPCVAFASDAGQRIREKMCSAAVNLGRLIQYRSAGTVEFVVDVDSAELNFYFLELNARIQVEHGVTEAVHPGLDLVELMIRQGLELTGSLDISELDQAPLLESHGHSIEARVYCENPKAGFKPSPGQLHLVEWADVGEGGRIDTWVKTGTMVTPHYDPMIAKIIVHGSTRDVAIRRMIDVLCRSKVTGPPTNMDYCRAVLSTEAFATGTIHTTFLDTFEYSPTAVEVLSPGMATTVQDLPGRFVGLGIPRGGPADMLSFQAANVLVGNNRLTEALEITMIGPKLLFHADAVVAITGCQMKVTLDSEEVPQWSTLSVRRGQVLHIETAFNSGIRSYLAIRGGLTNTASFLGSKSTFVGASLGGHLGRALLAGDLLEIAPVSSAPTVALPLSSVPLFSHHWEVEVCPGAQWDENFISKEGMEALLSADWKVTPASNRSGLRLEGPRIRWARTDGGEGYPFGALNMNGDTPVLFGVDSPDMGGFACVLTVATGSFWKLGQIRPGDTLRFICISPSAAPALEAENEQWLSCLMSPRNVPMSTARINACFPSTSVLHRVPGAQERAFRQAGDRFVLYEVGSMSLDLKDRVRVELWERAMRSANICGVINFNTCVRSCLVQFDPSVIPMETLVNCMSEIDAGLAKSQDMELDMNILRLPVVPDDRWCQEAVQLYMATSRKEAVYLPSNIKYLARNNGVEVNSVVDALTKTPWLVIARGFFAMLPFMILDPRRRLVAQKYNPTRTRTPEGAIGLAGVIGSIYPIASAGGYQLLGRTLSTWQAWAENHSLVENFDQIEFFTVTEEEYVKIERAFKAGIWQPERRKATFSMANYLRMVDETQPETDIFTQRQAVASREVAEEEEALFAKYLKEKESTAEQGSIDGEMEGVFIPSPLYASVFKVLVKPGDSITSDQTHLIELEAMKTSVFVAAGEGMAGQTVRGVAVKEGDSVTPGTPLVFVG